ncbi:MAG: Gfo/Idh/MocA family oxidoreductase [Planctomycetota bacterium]|nr:Gfo/Idh/MocA family oxidoreductase [Planctomycetota bacterium]
MKRRITLLPSDFVSDNQFAEMSAKLRILVVGVGSIGERHTRCFQQTARADVSICEVNDGLRAQIADRYELANAFGNWDDALASEFQAAVICTPADLHIPMAIDVAQLNRHLLIEKPLSTNLDRADELKQLVDSSGVAVMVAYVMRVHPALGAMKAAIDSGRFGKPVHVVGCSGQHFPTYRPAYRDIYYRDRATGGGAIQDALTHMINAAEWLVGPIDRLAADCSHQVLKGVDVEDTVNVIARHAGVLAAYSMNQYQAPNESSLTVVCQRGTVRFESHQQRWRWQTDPAGQWHDEPCEPLERDDLFIAQAHRFLDVAAGLAPPTCSLDEATSTLRANQAILRACASGAWESP